MKDILALVTDPDDFFTLLRDRQASLRAAAIVVTVFAVLSATAAWLWLAMVIDLGVPEDGKFLLRITLAFTEGGAMVTGLVTWLLGTVVVYFLVTASDPHIPLRKLLQATGLAHWPLLVYGVLTFILALFLRPESAGPFSSPAELADYINNSTFTHLTGQLRLLAYGETMLLCITAVRNMYRVWWGKATVICLPAAVLVAGMYLLVTWGGRR